MRRNLWWLAFLAIGTAWGAQESVMLGKEDLLRAFEQYNPAALEKAASLQAYGAILNELAENYSAPATEAQKYELIGLVKNFDNSLRLQLLREKYFQSRTLQEMSSFSTDFTQQIRAPLTEVLQSIFDNTLEVKQIQLADYKQQLKAKPTAELKAQIKQLKQEIRQCKKSAKQKIQATAQTYLTQ